MTTPQLRMMVASAILLLAPCIGLAESKSNAQISPADLVKAVIHNELQPSSGPESRWKYRLDKESDGKQETREVIETKSGSMDRLLSVAGKPLTGVQASDEAGRILRFSHSAEEQRKAEQTRRYTFCALPGGAAAVSRCARAMLGELFLCFRVQEACPFALRAGRLSTGHLPGS